MSKFVVHVNDTDSRYKFDDVEPYDIMCGSLHEAIDRANAITQTGNLHIYVSDLGGWPCSNQSHADRSISVSPVAYAQEYLRSETAVTS